MGRSTLANQWMRENGFSWGPKKHQPGGGLAKTNSTKKIRKRRSKSLGRQSKVHIPIKRFVEQSRDYSGHDCLCVPAAQLGVPAKLEYLGKTISAARYMLLLTRGVPKSEAMVTRHLCGNGHLSCVNPSHLAWGTDADNFCDMVKHHHAGPSAQDRIRSVE